VPPCGMEVVEASCDMPELRAELFIAVPGKRIEQHCFAKYSEDTASPVVQAIVEWHQRDG
jgi:hypothetical protein